MEKDDTEIEEFSEGDEYLFFEKYCPPESNSVMSGRVWSRTVARSEPAEKMNFFERVFAFGRVRGKGR